MNVVVLGHLVLDEIHPHTGPVIESLGGVYFPVAAFGAIAGGNDTVRPCFPVGEDAWERFRGATALFPRVDLAGCRPTARPNTRVRLFHDACAEYNTQLVCNLPPIPDALFTPFVPDADLVYINFMTGEDLTLGSAERLRGMTRALLYLDVHMIAYRVGAHGHRAPHPVADWRRWAEVADVIQCNQRELAVFVPGYEDEASRAAAVLEASRVRRVVVTKGGNGVSVYGADGRLDVPAVPVPAVVDSTGCGDVFGSTFAYFLARGETPADAAARAVRAGAFTVTIPGSHGMERLRDVVWGEGRCAFS